MTVMTRSVATRNITERARTLRALLTPLHLYYAGVVALALVNVYLLVHMAFAWKAAKGQNTEALAQQTVAMKTAEIAKKPLEGLDEKLVKATADADKFYARRLPYSYSEWVGELGALAKKQGVKLTRGQYVDSAALEGGTLTEVRMDTSLSGDYRPLVLFMNELERDKMFFLITGMTFTGQQSGTVGLRLRLTTYLRAPVGAEIKKSAVASEGAPSGDSGGGVPR